MTHTKIINSFTLVSGYGFLSNFHTSSIWMDGKRYPSIEHAYQAYKTTDEKSRELIRNAKSPGEAKKLGHSLPLRSDWDNIKLPLMREFIRKKFENPFLAHQLLSTGDAELVYGNTWNDRFWGICRGSGQNMLGIILMETRDELRKNQVDSLEEKDETSYRCETGPEAEEG